MCSLILLTSSLFLIYPVRYQCVMENAEAKGTQDTYCTKHLCSVIFTIENHICLQVYHKKIFFEIIELFQTYQKL